MPEGPEVKIMTEFIGHLANSKALISVTVIKDSFLKRTEDLDKIKLPQNIIAVESKGKFTYLLLEDKTAIGITYGMTGNITLKEHKHNAVQFICSDGTVFYYNSIRHFGTVVFMTNKELTEKLDSLGNDILNLPILSEQELVSRWRTKNNKNICSLLIQNQELVCGIGNYLKSEILYNCKVYPLADVKELSDNVLYELYINARTVAYSVYILGGPYKSHNVLKIYDQITDPLGNKIDKIETPDKRSTHWVPSLQTIGKPKPILITLKPKLPKQ